MHYGSVWTTTEYNTTATTLSAGITFLGINRLALTISGDYVDTEASFDPVSMPEVSDEVLEEIESGDYDYSSVHLYSDLAYSRIDLSITGDYQIGEETTFTGQIMYIDFADDNGYVYGDQSGSLLMFRAGVTFGLR